MKRFVAMMMLVVVLMVSCAPESTQPNRDPVAPIQEDTQSMSKGTLPAEIKEAVLKSVAAEQNVSADQLQVTEVEEADWPDACLGLAGPDEMCAQMMTPGWALTVTDGENTWQYRTDLDALQVRAAG